MLSLRTFFAVRSLFLAQPGPPAVSAFAPLLGAQRTSRPNELRNLERKECVIERAEYDDDDRIIAEILRLDHERVAG